MLIGNLKPTAAPGTSPIVAKISKATLACAREGEKFNHTLQNVVTQANPVQQGRARGVEEIAAQRLHSEAVVAQLFGFELMPPAVVNQAEQRLERVVQEVAVAILVAG